MIGGGHAGIEAAWAGANAGLRVALVTLDPTKIGVMSCNPAIGGLAKGQIVREIDALGGLMGEVTDATGIMFKMLNTSKGPAVRSPRAQCDKHAYAREVQRRIAEREHITVIPAAADSFLIEERRQQRGGFGGTGRVIAGVRLSATTNPELDGLELSAPAIVLTTGTFMRGLMHTGEQQTPGGRAGEAPATGMSRTLLHLGFELGRLKTGTPPRLRRRTINWEALEPQYGDECPAPFSDLTELNRFPGMEQVECRITSTCGEFHEIIRANLHRAPIYSGQIESAGPRYCPSIEDKIVRFSQREMHHIFLEPESHESDWVYCNGISTSLPADVQDRIVPLMPGCERAEILQYGYAVEYDMVRPHQIDATGMTKLVDGLFLAGQINGTSGYEEAGGQGLIAGINAIQYVRELDPLILGRDEAYIGVLMDDLITKTPVEPYRMFTSRAEYRLLLRSDNAPDRLTPIGRRIGIIDEDRWSRFERRRASIHSINQLIDSVRRDGMALSHMIKRPRFSLDDLVRNAAIDAADLPRGVLETILAERQYAGYIDRHRAEIRRQQEAEHRTIPRGVDFRAIAGLRAEAAEALSRFRPATFGQAGRIEGVSAADLTLLHIVLLRRPRPGRGQERSVG